MTREDMYTEKDRLYHIMATLELLGERDSPEFKKTWNAWDAIWTRIALSNKTPTQQLCQVAKIMSLKDTEHDT